jgi:hypothetical protein
VALHLMGKKWYTYGYKGSQVMPVLSSSKGKFNTQPQGEHDTSLLTNTYYEYVLVNVFLRK